MIGFDLLCKLVLFSQERVFNNAGPSPPISSHLIGFSLTLSLHSGHAKPILNVDSPVDDLNG